MSGFEEFIYWRLFKVDAITREQLEALLANREAERRAESATLSELNRRVSRRFDELPAWWRLWALARYGSRAEYVRRTRRLDHDDNRTEEQ